MGNVEKVKILFSDFFNRYTFKTAPKDLIFREADESACYEPSVVLREI